NFFAFQLLMAVAAATVAARGAALRTTLLALLFAGLWFCASRSAWVTLPFVLAASLYLRTARLNEIAMAIACAAGAALIAAFLPVFATGDFQSAAIPLILPTPEQNEERFHSILGGLQLFYDHPIFGAG